MPWKGWWGNKKCYFLIGMLFFSPLWGEENATFMQEVNKEEGNFTIKDPSSREIPSLEEEKKSPLYTKEEKPPSFEKEKSPLLDKEPSQKPLREEDVFTLFPEDPQFLYESRYIPGMPSSLTPIEEAYPIEEKKEKDKEETPSFVSLEERKEENSFFSSPLFLEKILPLGILLFLFGLFVIVRSYAQRRKAL